MPVFDLEYETLSRRDRRHKRVEAESIREVLRAVPARAGGATAIREVGTRKLLWHSRTGDVSVATPTSVLCGENERVLEVWNAERLCRFLGRNRRHGVFAERARAYVTRDSGQSQDLQAVVSFADVFSLVEAGRLLMVPALFQSYWFYRTCGPEERDGVLLPGSIPTISGLDHPVSFERVSA